MQKLCSNYIRNNGSFMEIKSLTKDDIKNQALVHSLSFRKAYKGIIPDSFLDNFTIEKREKYFTDNYEKYKDTFTIKEHETLIGFSTIGKNRDNDKGDSVGEVWGIYIHSDYWGKRYGSRLFDFVISELKKRGYKEITLWVLEKNQKARTFYEKKGFLFDGTKREINLGEKLIEIRYSLAI